MPLRRLASLVHCEVIMQQKVSFVYCHSGLSAVASGGLTISISHYMSRENLAHAAYLAVVYEYQRTGRPVSRGRVARLLQKSNSPTFRLALDLLVADGRLIQSRSLFGLNWGWVYEPA